MDVRDFISEKIGREVGDDEIELRTDILYTGGVCKMIIDTFYEFTKALGVREVYLGAHDDIIYFMKKFIEDERVVEWNFTTPGFDFELWYGEKYKII